MVDIHERGFEYDWAHYARFQGARIMEFRVYIDTAPIVVTLQQQQFPMTG